MLAGLETKRVIVRRGQAGVDHTAPCPTGLFGDIRRGDADPIDVAIFCVYPSTTEARQTGRRSLV